MSYAYATLVMLNEKYVAGALVLARSIKDSGSKHDLICMIDESISELSRQRLELAFTHVVVVPLITIRAMTLRSKKQRGMYGEWISNACNKWHIINPNLVPGKKYKSIIFIDADTLVKKNIDELFMVKAPASCFSNPWSYQYGIGTIIDRYSGRRKELNHGEIIDPTELEAALDWNPPGLMHGTTPATFSASGSLAIIPPSAQLWEIFHWNVSSYLLKDVNFGDEVWPVSDGDAVFGNQNCSSGCDEQMLSRCLLGLKWNIRHIHQRFNWLAGKTKWYDGDAPVIHYCNEKPWDTREKWDDTEQWWNVYENIVALEKEAGINAPNIVPAEQVKKSTKKSKARSLDIVNTLEYQTLMDVPSLSGYTGELMAVLNELIMRNSPRRGRRDQSPRGRGRGRGDYVPRGRGDQSTRGRGKGRKGSRVDVQVEQTILHLEQINVHSEQVPEQSKNSTPSLVGGSDSPPIQPNYVKHPGMFSGTGATGLSVSSGEFVPSDLDAEYDE